VSGDREYLLPNEIFDRVGVPDAFRAETAYRVLAAKYCALVEAVMKITGGEPVEISLDRAMEINAQTHLTDPRETVIVTERKKDDAPGPVVYVGLATPDEVRAANRRYALQQMGARRN
jgi:hypothetical protein